MMGSLKGVRIEIDKAKLAEVETLLADIKNGSTKALVRAINKTLRGAGTDAAREVYEILNLTQAKIKTNFKTTKATYDKVAGKFGSTGDPIPLIDYGAKGRKTGGVGFKIKKNSASKVLKGAFVARMKSGHLGVFMRQAFNEKYTPSQDIGEGTPIGQPGPEYYYTWPRVWREELRLPIFEVKSTRIEDAMGDQIPLIMVKVNDRFVKDLDHEVSYLIYQMLESGDGF